jgi:heme exporter protein B
MAVQTRTRDVLLPILLFPVVLPVLIASVKASAGFLQGLGISEVMPYINLLIVYDVIFIAVSFMVFDFVVEEYRSLRTDNFIHCQKLETYETSTVF